MIFTRRSFLKRQFSLRPVVITGLLLFLVLLTSPQWVMAADGPWLKLATGSCDSPNFTSEMSAGDTLLIVSGGLMPNSPFYYKVTPYGETSRDPWWYIEQTITVDPNGNVCVEAFASSSDDYGSFGVSITALRADQHSYNTFAVIHIQGAPTPTDTPTPEPTATTTPTVEPTAMPTTQPTDTPAPAPSATATSTLQPTATSTIEPTATPTEEATNIPAPAPTLTSTPTPTHSPTPVPTKQKKPKPTTVPPTATPTEEPSTATPTVQPTATPRPSATAQTKQGQAATNVNAKSDQSSGIASAATPLNLFSGRRDQVDQSGLQVVSATATGVPADDAAIQPEANSANLQVNPQRTSNELESRTDAPNEKPAGTIWWLVFGLLAVSLTWYIARSRN